MTTTTSTIANAITAYGLVAREQDCEVWIGNVSDGAKPGFDLAINNGLLWLDGEYYRLTHGADKVMQTIYRAAHKAAKL